MRRITFALTSALAACLATACEPTPQTISENFPWQEAVSDMRSALLGACSFEGVLYAVGGPYSDGTLYRFTGRRWSQEGSMLHGERLWSCWAGPSNQLIAVGQNGTIFRRNNEGWHRDQVPEEVLEAGAPEPTTTGRLETTARRLTTMASTGVHRRRKSTTGSTEFTDLDQTMSTPLVDPAEGSSCDGTALLGSNLTSHQVLCAAL